jgi:lauroyl/myristoyl acyltransferase
LGDDWQVIRRGVDLAKSVFHFASRGAERVLPPMALWALLWPLNEALALRQALLTRERVPAARLPLPPDAERPGLLLRWRHFSRGQRHWWLLSWIDRLAAPKWQRRLNIQGADKLTAALAERPVIVCSLHTTSVGTIAAWLRSLGIPAAHVPMDMAWFSNPARLRKRALAEKMGMAITLRPDQPRAMVEFLKPGKMLVLPADHTGGRVINVPWRDASVTVATGLFRIARSTGAAVAPMLIFETGRWRYEMTVFDPVPQDVIEAGDNHAAARYVVDRLMPMVAERPDQAMAVLVAAVRESPPATRPG